jgi:hypothetical protein
MDEKRFTAPEAGTYRVTWGVSAEADIDLGTRVAVDDADWITIPAAGETAAAVDHNPPD